MITTTYVHPKNGTKIEAISATRETGERYGYVNMVEGKVDLTIIPDSADLCLELAAAWTEAAQGFDHARPMGVPAVDARDEHDGEALSNG
jgi:hypothetical protein